MIERNLRKPLSSIPDPFNTFKSFAEYNNNNKLKEFLNEFDFDFEFKSATDLYKNGTFNSGLELIFENYDKIMNIILPTLRKERRLTYSPFLQSVGQLEKFFKLKLKI